MVERWLRWQINKEETTRRRCKKGEPYLEAGGGEIPIFRCEERWKLHIMTENGP